MNEKIYWTAILDKLEKDETVVLVVIINQTGSAPNAPGAKMVVMDDNIIGTIGGGISEHNLIDYAEKMLSENRTEVKTVHLEHSETDEKNRSGMICSGAQTFALLPLTKKETPFVKAIIQSYDEVVPGIITITQNGINFDFGKTLEKNHVYTDKEDVWSYQENAGQRDRLFIIGGGHVSLALSRIMETLGFHITVYDNRLNLPTMFNNSYANIKGVINYEQIANLIPEGNNTYITIMTFGHESDEYVLEKLVLGDYKYLGMMASVAKMKQVFENLENKGIAKEMLDRVHSPIGLKIGSIKPEEIAISIAAEIVQIKNKV